jgi:phosphoribosylformimino-5-aminoimidazole carboxamide ribotide isomerase
MDMGEKAIEFTIYPAIDLRKGKVVRLVQGDPRRQTVYSDDPSEAAHRWLLASTQGTFNAPWLHIVNLDGALGIQSAANQQALKAIVQTCETFQGNIQFGGGLRTLGEIEQTLSLGIRRVLLGTAAVNQPELVRAAIAHFGPQKIGVALDARDGRIQVNGWTTMAEITPLELGEELFQYGVRNVIFTNIARDGTGRGVDIDGAAEIAERTRLNVIASGGVNSLEDIHRAKQAGLAGIIIGKALYEGSIDLQEALRC